ncbi:MAG TPA: phosphatase PAP2 family protein [Myxococcaceae bacterium]|nr:phosphatase PAP2 family protein [Myxococcaceae bacterium]
MRATLRHLREHLPWRDSSGIGLLLLLLGLLAATLGFIALWDEVAERETQHFDEWALRALREPGQPADALGPEWLSEAARDVTGLGSAAVLVLVVCAVAGFLALVRRWETLMLVVGSTVGGVLVNVLLKRVLDRPRPTVVPQLTWVATESFPSGHAMLSATVYLTMAALLAQLTDRRWLKAYLLGVALTATLLVGLTRVYLGVHYPTDVLGGWLAGVAWALLSALVVRVVRRHSHRLEEEAEGRTTPP